MKELKYDYSKETNRLGKDVLSFEEKKAFRARERKALRANSIEAIEERLAKVSSELRDLETRKKIATSKKSEAK